jgi:hypothetical protein
MPFLTQSEYARRVGVSRQAVHRQVAAGVIPVHGEGRLIDAAEADACYGPDLRAAVPQMRVGAPAMDAALAHEVAAAAWRAWVPAAAARLARALEVEAEPLRALLVAAVEAQLAAVGLGD